MYKYLLGILVLLFSIKINGQNYTISGYITDDSSGESLIGANIIDIRSGKGTVTNTYGFYSITLPSDSITLAYSYIGYQTKLLPIYLDEDRSINPSLSSELALDEVEIVADKVTQLQDQVQMSTISIPINQLKKIPALLGETDILKAIQLLPGVQSGGEGQSGLYVRGGSQDQNLMLLDGTPVYNASHLFGFFSVFNSDAIKDVKLVKGGFPARYGGRLSSVLEINMKEGNNKSFHGSGSIGLVASKFAIEGPIVKDKVSFIVSARRTYIDILARPLVKLSLSQEGSDGKFGYYFYDMNAKVNWKISDKDRIYLSAYTGDDKFYTDISTTDELSRNGIDLGMGWGNITSALRWNHLWTDKLFSNLTFTYSNYNFSIDSGSENTEYNKGQVESISNYSFAYDTGIFDYSAKLEFDYIPAVSHFLKFGVQTTYHNFVPNNTKLFYEFEGDGNASKLDTSFGQSKINALEYIAYIEDDYKVTDRLRVNGGFHFSGFYVSDKNFTSLQPRIALNYKLPNDIGVKASFATMRQYIQYLTNESIGLPWDQWLPSTDIVRPQSSWQAALGFAKTINRKYEISIEGYYKEMNDITAYKEGASIFSSKDWQTQVTQGEGRSYGVEFLLQKKTGKLSGWLGYTLSYSDRRFDDKNFGKWYPFTFDRRHDLSLVILYELSEKWNFSGTWVYGTGNSYTMATSLYYVDILDAYEYFPQVSNITERNNYRLEPYHRADINFDYSWQKKRAKHKISFGAYNLYSRKNPFFINIETVYDDNGEDIEERQVLKQYSLFPIIPSISYSFEF